MGNKERPRKYSRLYDVLTVKSPIDWEGDSIVEVHLSLKTGKPETT